MKKPRKKPNPELRVRIEPAVMRALRLAVAREAGYPSGRTAGQLVQEALSHFPTVAKEME